MTEEIILHLVRALLKKHPVRNLCMTGGVALNCVANAKILEQTDVQRLWVPPCASDTGAPLGSALWHYHQNLGHPRGFELKHALYGKAYGDDEIVKALEVAGLGYRRMSQDQLLPRVAKDLADGKVVGWFQGRFEMGPRALGNRSILADPRRADMRDILNAKVKKRESFRPFAPAVLVERAHEFFEIDQPDPFMTLAPRVRAECRDRIPAAVHVDGTGRIQTVERSTNPRYYGLIEEFGRLTGVPVLLNTSFNRTEPIVASPADAVNCYLRTEMDVLVMGDFYTTDRGPASAARVHGARPAGAGARRSRRGCALGRRHARLGGRAPAALHPLTRTAAGYRKAAPDGNIESGCAWSNSRFPAIPGSRPGRPGTSRRRGAGGGSSASTAGTPTTGRTRAWTPIGSRKPRAGPWCSTR